MSSLGIAAIKAAKKFCLERIQENAQRTLHRTPVLPDLGIHDLADGGPGPLDEPDRGFELTTSEVGTIVEISVRPIQTIR